MSDHFALSLSLFMKINRIFEYINVKRDKKNERERERDREKSFLFSRIPHNTVSTSNSILKSCYPLSIPNIQFHIEPFVMFNIIFFVFIIKVSKLRARPVRCEQQQQQQQKHHLPSPPTNSNCTYSTPNANTTTTTSTYREVHKKRYKYQEDRVS